MKQVLAASMLVSLVTFVRADDWPQWRGPDRDGVWRGADLPDKLPEQVKPLWKQPLGGGYSGIAVVDGRVYTMDYQKKPRQIERVLCLDARTGKTLWTHEYNVDYAKMQYGNGPRATPTVRDNKVYTFGARGHLFCLDAKTGKVVWSHDTVKDLKGRVPMWGHSCSPLLDGNRVLVQVGAPGAGLIAFDRDTGKEVWRALDERPGYSSPVSISGKGWRQIAYFGPDYVAGLDPETGKRLWRVGIDPITYDVSISDPVFHDGVLLTADYWTGCRAIKLDEDGRNPKVIYDDKRLSLLMSTPLYRNGHIYGLDRKDGLKCIELQSGAVKWEDVYITPRGRNPQATLVWAGKRALIFNERCELILARLTPEKFEEISRTNIIEKNTWAHPAYADGCIFVRTNEEIVCVPLTGR